MRIRRAIFWMHLFAGVAAALVIVMMSVTGVILTYERQMKDWADRSLYDIPVDGERLTVDELLAAARRQDPDMSIRSIAMFADRASPPAASQGRSGMQYLDPVTGDILGPGNTELRGFFRTMMFWHRWFALTDDARATGKAITGASNLLFLFLIVSGIYLWLPPIWRWLIIRTRLLFNERATSAKARDYNWHHVFGFWIFLPLFLVVLSATPISYPWARSLVYTVTGTPQPVRGQSGGDSDSPGLAGDTQTLSLQAHFDQARASSSDWRRIDVSIPASTDMSVGVSIDEGTGGEPHKKSTLTFDRISGDLIATETFADRTAASKVLSYFRWVHTGEAHGLIGQTVAGIVSALAVLMAWTGLALSWRRLISPILRRRRLARTAQ